MKLRKWSPRFLRFFTFYIFDSKRFYRFRSNFHTFTHILFFYYDVLFFLSLFLPRTFILFKILKIFTRNKFKLIICHVKHAQVKRQALVDIKEDLYNSFFFSSGGMSNLIEQGKVCRTDDIFLIISQLFRLHVFRFLVFLVFLFQIIFNKMYK